MRAVMRIRRTALAEGHELECHRSVGGRAVTPAHDLFEAVRACAERDQRVAVLQWLSGRGPFWDDAREHSADRWYEALGDVVTDSAVAEAAERIRNGRATDLVSASPSDWLSTPLVVEEVDGAGSRIPTPVENHWTTSTVEARARELRGPIGSWADLEARCRRVSRLVFADDSFAPLGSEPFHRGLAEEILTRVETLGRLTACLTRDGQLSAAGLALQQQFCVGDKAWFTDSSAGEKIDFKDDLTFRDPLRPGGAALLHLARQGEEPADPHPLQLARPRGRGRARGLRRAEDHQEVGCDARGARLASPIDELPLGAGGRGRDLGGRRGGAGRR
jgi:hypothetical protein